MVFEESPASADHGALARDQAGQPERWHPGPDSAGVFRPAASSPIGFASPTAGIYWYHPHVREDIQQELGLYGNLLVRSSGAGRIQRGQPRGGPDAR